MICIPEIAQDGPLKGMTTEDCGVSYDRYYLKESLITHLVPYYYSTKRNKKWVYNIEYCEINGKLKTKETCSEILEMLE